MTRPVTRYFDEQVRRKRPYVTVDRCAAVVRALLHRAVQADGRVRPWGEIMLDGETSLRVLRVVLLDVDWTLHNAFLDRGFERSS